MSVFSVQKTLKKIQYGLFEFAAILTQCIMNIKPNFKIYVVKD
jgi:hypothetical protein